jgi:hypothetical protein
MDIYPEDVTQTADTISPVVTPEADTAPEPRVTVEEFKISGDALVAKVRELIHQGNIRRISIKNETGHTLIEIPLTVGVIGGAVGAAVFPVVAALGVIGAMVAHLTIVVERQNSDAPHDADPT